MNDSQIAELDSAQRVRTLLVGRPADVPAGSRAAALRDRIETTITDIEQEAAKQLAASLDRQKATEQKQAASKTLLEQMRSMNLTARSINPQFPGIADQFKMGRPASDQAMLDRARAFISLATPTAAQFTSRGQPATFLTDMQATITAVEAAEALQSEANTRLSEATANLKAAFKTLRDDISELDAIFKAKRRTDPGALAAWHTASHVEKAPKKAVAKKPTTPPSS
ncbi:MAG: hypothetical protein QOF02_857 [Blastocatellia bacterium]|jgi:hypothetical protein|nr:hypothetical protein [Blastocatellia bacterium]